MKFSLLFILLIIIYNCSFRNTNSMIVGQYSGGSEFIATDLVLCDDYSFKYKEFLDVGGWRKPLFGNWKIEKDTLFLTSSNLPNLIRVEETTKEIESKCLTVSLWHDSVFPYSGTYGITLDSIDCKDGRYDSLLIDKKKYVYITYYDFDKYLFKIKNPSLKLNLNGAHYSYQIMDTNRDHIKFFFDVNEDSIIFRSFLDEQRWLLRGDTLFGLYEGKATEEYYLTKKK